MQEAEAERKDLIFNFDRYPYLTSDLPAVSGRIRQEAQDFQVVEVPREPFTGEGEHLLLFVEKENWTTRRLVEFLREALELPEDDIGWAGLKDRHAITRQWISVPIRCREAIASLAWPEGMRLLELAQHSGKLQEGYLAGNRFRILVREPKGSAAQAEAVLQALATRGVPNYFGPQRFGSRGNNAVWGLKLIRKGRGRSKNWRDKLQINALQSLLFNDWVALRMQRDLFDRVLLGDIAVKHATGGKFQVGDLAADLPRAQAFEISATGPLFGRKYHEAHDDARLLEDEVLAAHQLTRADFNGSPGSRRPLRFPLEDWRVEEAPEGLWLSFYLPRGAYATAVLREVMQANPETGEGEPES